MNNTAKSDRAAAKRAAAERAAAQRASAARRRRVLAVGSVALAAMLVAGAVAGVAGIGPFAKEKAAPVDMSKPPKVTKGSGDVKKLKVTTLKAGDGAAVKKGDKIRVHYTGVTYTDGKQFDSSWENGQPVTFPIGVGRVIKGWDEGLVGVKAGSRVQLDIPAEMAYGTEPSQNGAPTGDLRFVVDVISAKPAPPPVDPKDAPKVTKGEGDVKELKVTVLKEGTGPAVKGGQTVTVHYTGVTYADGEKFDSSWEKGEPAEFEIGTGKVIPGWDKGLVGAKVGSRVQLDIPAEMAYGTEPNQNGAPTGDLRFVVDIVGAE